MDALGLTSRRYFLKQAGLGGALITTAAGQARVLGANDRINVAFIGTGGRGNWLMDLVLKHRQAKPDVEIVAVCDVYQKRLSAASQKAGGAKMYVHHEKLLQRSDIDAVFIATPDHWHAPITLLAMETGKDVYVEKPMTHTVEEAKHVAHRALELKRIVQVGVQGTSWTRWHRMKEIVQSGMIGKVVAVQGTYSRNDPQGDWNWPIDPGAGPNGKGEDHIDWVQWLGAAPARSFDADRFFRFRKYWDYSGGIATDLHYHIVAPFHVALPNDHPTRVVGMGGAWIYKDGREVPDTFLTAADYPSNYSMTIQSSQVNENGPVLLLRGTEATIHLGDEWEGPQGRRRDYAQIVPESPFVESFKKKFGKEEVRIDGVGNEGDLKHVDNFLDCVRSRQQPNCHADLGFKVMTTIDLSVRSYRNGKMYYFDAGREQVVEKE
jgi:predicted dehydrogenase